MFDSSYQSGLSIPELKQGRLCPSAFPGWWEHVLIFSSRTERRKSLFCWLSCSPLVKGKVWISHRGKLWGEYEPAALRVFQETQILRSDLSSVDFAMLPADHARAGMSVKIQQAETPRNCRSHKIPKLYIFWRNQCVLAIAVYNLRASLH